jgi:hypothetical protein
MNVETIYTAQLNKDNKLIFKSFDRGSYVYTSHLISSITGGCLNRPLSSRKLEISHLQSMTFESVKLLIDHCTSCIENGEEMTKATDDNPSLVWDIVIAIVNKNLEGK